MTAVAVITAASLAIDKQNRVPHRSNWGRVPIPTPTMSNKLKSPSWASSAAAAAAKRNPAKAVVITSQSKVSSSSAAATYKSMVIRSQPQKQQQQSTSVFNCAKMLPTSRARGKRVGVVQPSHACGGWWCVQSLSLLVLLVVMLSALPVASARHYIAPGPCSWNHVAAHPGALLSSSSRDNRYKSSHESNRGDFDVALSCSVPVLKPYTLNTSLIEPEQTVKLSISCLGQQQQHAAAANNVDSAEAAGELDLLSTLRVQHENGRAPFEHLTNLASLEIDFCKFDRLPSEAFRGLVAVRNLTIRNARLSEHEPLMIEANSFQHLSAQVEHLDLSYNNMDTLPNALFCPFVHLKLLNLSHNNLPDVSSFGIVHTAGLPCLHTVTHMDLSHNHLDAMPESVGLATLKNLRVLNLSSNVISEIGDLAFQTLNNIEVVDLSNNRIRKLPDKMIRTCIEIRELHLGNNLLTTLPVAFFGGLSKLVVVDLSGNQLTSAIFIQDFMIDQIRLVVLDLSRNQFRTIPNDIFVSLYSLQILSLENNDLESIGDGAFNTLYNLHSLNLGGNRFHQLSDHSFSGLFVLHELILTDNQIDTIHEEAFKNCSNLKEIDISGNRLTAFPKAFRFLRSVEKINFSRNKLMSLTEPGSLVHISHLKHLDLSDNYLTNVSRAAFRPMVNSLEVLRLDGNQLKHLEKNTIDDLKRTLRVLRLDRNGFSDLSNSLTDIKQLEKLEVLNISRNDISWFDYALLPVNLRSLDIRSNKIEVLGNYYELETQLRLEELDVSHNLIKEITASSIPNSIRRLNLRANLIEKVDQFAFVAKHNVTFVDLRNNSMSRIDNNAFRLGVQRPTSSYFFARAEQSEFDAKYLPPPIFMISHNPLYCDCTMEWLQRVNQLVGGVTGSGAISTYPRIADLEDVICELPFARQANQQQQQQQQSKSALATVEPTRVPLMQANSSNFLCRYRTHCFALCHCCEFDACDCEMMCPENCTCYYDQTWNTNIVDCSAANYKAVPARIPMDVTALYLDGNNMPALNAHTFIGRKNLRVLHLNHSLVETIANRSFNGLVYLEELHLEHNRLTALNGYEFEALHYLTSLHLDHNAIEFIHDRTFASMRSLQVLRLDHNALINFGLWFTPSGLMPATLVPGSSLTMQRHLYISFANNPWACECHSIGTMYSTLRALSDQLHVTDYLEVRCIDGATKQSNLLLMREAKDSDTTALDRCNLTGSLLLPFEPPKIEEPASNFLPETTPPTTKVQVANYPESDTEPSEVIQTTAIDQPQQPQGPPAARPPMSANPAAELPGNSLEANTKVRNRGDNVVANKEEDISFQPFDLFDKGRQNKTWLVYITSSWLIITVVLSIGLTMALAFLLFHKKQDIQLWFYRRYNIRLFESGLFGACRRRRDSESRGTSRRRGNGVGSGYVKDSEKLFDSFVIYAQHDESFVTQQLAAELECGYPPYRLCLRYRDLPAPSTHTTTTPMIGGDAAGGNATVAGVEANNKTDSEGFAFDAVTQAIECSRRTLVVVSENFLQSEWCRFELKAAHQETVSSCKTHRLIIVLVPSIKPMQPQPQMSQAQQLLHQQQQIAKGAEQLIQHLDSETRACLRNATLLTWGERRFWEKLRFSMPSNSAQTGGNDGTKGRGGAATAVMVTTGNGYPSSKGNSQGSNSSLARSSMLYDPLYYHHYQYAQLPVVSNGGSNTASLNKSSSMSIFRNSSNSNSNNNNNHNNNNVATMNSHRNPFTSKPLPPPPNQPLPPLPLVSHPNHFISQMEQHQQQQQPQYHMPMQHTPHHQAQSSTDQMLPTYASCSEYGEYETTGDSLMMGGNNPAMVGGGCGGGGTPVGATGISGPLTATRMSATRTMIHQPTLHYHSTPTHYYPHPAPMSAHSTPRRGPVM